MQVWEQWPWWLTESVRTVLLVGLAYGIGQLMRLLVTARLARLHTRRPGDWAEVILSEVRPRVGLWSVLAGLHFAIRRWPLDAGQHDDAQNVLSALAIGSLTFAVAAVATRLVSTHPGRDGAITPVSALTRNVIRIVVMVLGGLTIVGVFKYNITPYLTALGVSGLAVALALQDPLSNLFAGIFMSASGQVRLGEYVKLDNGVEGYVLDFNWRATSIRLLSGNVAIVPNAKLAQSTVTNFHQPSRDVGIGVEVVVDYGNDLALVERTAMEVAQTVVAEVHGVLKRAAPSVRFQSFTAAGVTVTVSMRSEEFADQFLIKHELIKRLHARFVSEGVAFRPPAPEPVHLHAH
jgi:small-conductance mechanosensitive channel